MAKFSLGDIVNMPLPTQWAPLNAPPQGGVPSAYAAVPGTVGGAGSGGPGQPGGTALIGGGGSAVGPAQGSPDGLRSGVSPTGLLIPGTAKGPTGLPSVWQPEKVLPDWILPPALQRSNPLLRRATYTPNKFDLALANKARWFAWIAAHGGLRSCCRIPELGAPIWSQPPWQVMPSNGLEYREMFGQPITAFQDSGGVFTGVDTVIGSWRVQNGYDGVLNQIVVAFDGDGFTDFSGNIVWRIKIDNRFGKNVGNITNTYGSFSDGLLVPGYGIRIISGQTITAYANIPVDSPVSGGTVKAGMFGWTYPRR